MESKMKTKHNICVLITIVAIVIFMLSIGIFRLSEKTTLLEKRLNIIDVELSKVQLTTIKKISPEDIKRLRELFYKVK